MARGTEASGTMGRSPAREPVGESGGLWKGLLQLTGSYRKLAVSLLFVGGWGGIMPKAHLWECWKISGKAGGGRWACAGHAGGLRSHGTVTCWKSSPTGCAKRPHGDPRAPAEWGSWTSVMGVGF